MSFSPEQVEMLMAPLNRSAVKERSQAGRSLSYIEAWHAIAEANRIFGFDAWTRETLDIRCVAEGKREGKEGYSVSYVAKVRVMVDGIVREGTGAGHGIDRALGIAHESAIKEAESDAMKRALMTFGNPFGLALYDKHQAQVVDDERPPPKPSAVKVYASSKPTAPADALGLNESAVRYFEEAKAAIAGPWASETELYAWWRHHEERRNSMLGDPQIDELTRIAKERRNELKRAA